MEASRLIVTGWRSATVIPHERVIAQGLSVAVHTMNLLIGGPADRIILVHGACPSGGVDELAEGIGRVRGWEIERHPADFAGLGVKAGPIRNKEMCAAGADFVVGFPGPGSKGTWDCLKWAAYYQIPSLTFGLWT